MQTPYISGGRTSKTAPATTASTPPIAPICAAVTWTVPPRREGGAGAGMSVVTMSYPLPNSGHEGSVITAAPVVGSRPVEVDAVNAYVLGGEKHEHGVTLTILESKGHATVGAQLLGSWNQLHSEAAAPQHGLGPNRVVGAEKADQPVHVLTAPAFDGDAPAAQPAMS